MDREFEEENVSANKKNPHTAEDYGFRRHYGKFPTEKEMRQIYEYFYYNAKKIRVYLKIQKRDLDL